MNGSKFLRFIMTTAAILSCFITHSVLADIALLVHGFDSNAMTWQNSGVNQYLDQQGWHYNGVLTAAGPSVNLLPVARAMAQQNPSSNGQQKLFNANLASTAPLEIQAQQLMAIIQWLNHRYPGEAIYLVGHSAGGLVARYAAVILFLQQPNRAAPNHIAGLITIASPHLGTGRAVQAIDSVESEPFFCPGPGWRIMRSLFGGDDYDLVKHSETLLYELYPSRPGSLLFWLNQQPHPVMPYFSVVRSSGGSAGDALVPGYSQNMNNIPALQGQTITLFSYSNHFLNPSDAVTIHGILTILTAAPAEQIM